MQHYLSFVMDEYSSALISRSFVLARPPAVRISVSHPRNGYWRSSYAIIWVNFLTLPIIKMYQQSVSWRSVKGKEIEIVAKTGKREIFLRQNFVHETQIQYQIVASSHSLSSFFAHRYLQILPINITNQEVPLEYQVTPRHTSPSPLYVGGCWISKNHMHGRIHEFSRIITMVPIYISHVSL